MWCEIFRQRFTDVVDQPKVKKGFACAFMSIVALGFVLGYIAGERYRAGYCRSHDCSNSSPGDDVTFKAVGIGLSVVVASTLFTVFTVLGIICCRLNNEVDEAERQSLLDSESAWPSTKNMASIQ